VIVFGLGNPGEKYIHTRHNAAWLVFDTFGLEWQVNKYAESLEAKSEEIVFVKPQTFMNNSGRSVSWYQKKYEIQTENVVVVYDDIDLPIGTVRISFDRGSGGHNGIKSIEEALQGRGFVRVRIGIAPRNEDGELQNPESRTVFVLKNFSLQDIETIRGLGSRVLDALKTIEEKGYVVAMNRFN